MNRDQVMGHWHQIKADAKVAWAKLTDDDWAEVEGDIEKLTGRIQERYGDAREAVAQKLNLLVGRIRENVHTPHQSESKIVAVKAP
jgi:uncharacterized protein YjbJ (UPF0337 family)